MAEPRKSRAQLDAQIERINRAYRSAVARTEYGSPEFRRQQNRWFNATAAHGRLRGDNRLIDSFRNYRPESRMFTSQAEMDRIDKHFGLSKRNVSSLNALRNNVVDYYANHDRRGNMGEWMQSITAVIDYHIRRKGGAL